MKARTSSEPRRLARCSTPPARAWRSAAVQRLLSLLPVPSPIIVPPYGCGAFWVPSGPPYSSSSFFFAVSVGTRKMLVVGLAGIFTAETSNNDSCHRPVHVVRRPFVVQDSKANAHLGQVFWEIALARSLAKVDDGSSSALKVSAVGVSANLRLPADSLASGNVPPEP